MALRVAVCGTGAFADSFIPLFKVHPLVDRLSLADVDREKLLAKAARFGVSRTHASLDEVCASDVDAVVLMTQHHLHGTQAVQALEAGKHVYSAVPPAITEQELRDLVRAVERTRLVYMLGETSSYYPCACYCRRRHRAGEFGRVVYAEAEYYHDFSHGMYDVMRWRHGAEWRRYAGIPPMLYPTHSVSMVVSVTGAHATRVSCQGWVDRDEDGLFDPAANAWGNPFSNQTALCRMSDGSVARFNEFRRIGHPGTVRLSMHGTLASYEEQCGCQMWVTRDEERCADLDGLPDRTLLPAGFADSSTAHGGSHPFLVHDFLAACASRTLPPNNVWQAARYLLPGLLAHRSALRGGELLEVPDLGDPPLEEGESWS